MLAEGPEPRPSRWRRGRLVRLSAFAVLLLACAVGLRRPLFQGNFGVVDPGRVYRSAQPQSGLEATIRALGLKAVVNLRGGSESDAFYAEEAQTAGRLGVAFYDLPMSATRRPTRRELLTILALFDRSPYPLLIHCKWGSDRTGLVAALYRMDVLGEAPETAWDAFTVSHGHVPLFGPERLHEPFREYAGWLRERGLAHSPQRFRRWVESEYRADDPFEGRPTVTPGPRTRSEAHRPRS